MRYTAPTYTTASPQPVLLDVPCPTCKAAPGVDCAASTAKVHTHGHTARQDRAANERSRWQTVQTEARWHAEDRDKAQQLAMRDEDEARRLYPDHLAAIDEVTGHIPA